MQTWLIHVYLLISQCSRTMSVKIPEKINHQLLLKIKRKILLNNTSCLCLCLSFKCCICIYFISSIHSPNFLKLCEKHHYFMFAIIYVTLVQSQMHNNSNNHWLLDSKPAKPNFMQRSNDINHWDHFSKPYHRFAFSLEIPFRYEFYLLSNVVINNVLSLLAETGSTSEILIWKATGN